MRVRRATLLSLISLVALTGAKLRWKCELFDTSQESSSISPRTTFVEFVKNKPPELNPLNGERSPRSTKPNKNCRPRPKNGTVAPPREAEQLTIRQNKKVIQQDPSGILGSGDTLAHQIKYHRKDTHQSLELNIGPGFDESIDPNGRSKQPASKKFRPAELKGADELDKPLAEHLDENVMPDFEFDEEEAVPVQENLPWCPEEEEEEVDCETADLKTLSLEKLIEFQEKCEETAAPESRKLLGALIKIEKNRGVVPKIDRTVLLPLTGSTNCSTSPSELSNKTLEKYRRECPCEEDVSVMNDKQFEIFKKDCLYPIEAPGKPFIRKNARCAASKKKTASMSDKEYASFVKECLVAPRNVELKKVLIIEKSSECKNQKPKNMSKEEFLDYQKKCVSSNNCDSVDQSKFNEKELLQFKRLCSPKINETRNICDEKNLDELDDEQFEKYKEECIIDISKNTCEDVDLESLSNSEYESYRKNCERSRINCTSVNPDELSKSELIEYNLRCSVKPEANCETLNPDELTDEEFKRYKEKCSNTISRKCAEINPQELNDEEYKEYKEECLTNETNCFTANSRNMTKEQYKKFKKLCLKGVPDCNGVDIRNLNDEEYEKFRRDCLKDYDCSSVGNLDELTEKEFLDFKKKCSRRVIPTPSSSPECENADPKNMSEKEYENYKSKCTGGSTVTVIKKVKINNGATGDESSPEKPIVSEACDEVDVDKMTDYEYKAYKKYCKVNFEGEDCDEVRVDDLNDEKLREYVKKCGLFCGIERKESLPEKYQKLYEERCEGDPKELEKDCKDILVENLGERMYGDFAEKCFEPIQPCSLLKTRRIVRGVYNEYRHRCKPRLFPSKEFKCEENDTENMSLEKFIEYKRRCRKDREPDCDNKNIEELGDQEVVEELKRKFQNVADRYLQIHADLLNERLIKLEEESEIGNNAVSEINQKIRQGTTALVVLIINKDLYILNCGSSLAIAMNRESAVQLNTNVHTIDNPSEYQRIKALGIEPETVLNPTRAIGDLQRTHLYEETEAFKNAKGSPVISDPDVQYYEIDPSWRHLVLLSDGVVQNLKEIEVENIPQEVLSRLIEDNTLTSTAQALADSFARKHLDAYIKLNDDKNCVVSNHREEMTIIYVELEENYQATLRENVDSVCSTMESTNQSMFESSPKKPYVDALNFNSGENYEKMKKLIFPN